MNILLNSYRLRDMVEKIISSFKLDAGISFNFKRRAISSVINDALLTKASAIKLKNIKIIKKLKKIRISYDYERMKDVFINLIDNAIKFSKQESKIEINTWIRKEKVYISVKDQGIGIHKEDIPKLFTKFYQTKEGKGYGGTGIGLSMIMKIVDAHNGSVKVKSEYGKGAEFIVILPKKVK